MTPSKIGVTGGAGSIGWHLCERLLAEGHQVIAVDDLSHGTTANMASFIQPELPVPPDGLPEPARAAPGVRRLRRGRASRGNGNGNGDGDAQGSTLLRRLARFTDRVEGTRDGRRDGAVPASEEPLEVQVRAVSTHHATGVAIAMTREPRRGHSSTAEGALMSWPSSNRRSSASLNGE